MEKIIKIAFVIKTEGLEYDDRVRKEILTILKYYPNINFMIYAMLPDNKEEEGVTSYGIPYKSVKIPARDKYPSRKKPLLKAYQFYSILRKELEGYDAIWAANVDASFFPMLVKNKHIIWDLHELPGIYLGSWWKLKILQYIFCRCEVILHANTHRIQYLEKLGAIVNPEKHYAIRNYPNFEDVDSTYDNTYRQFVSWKRDRKCVYLQGLTNIGRAAYESVSAILRFPELCAVVVGVFDTKVRERLEVEYGSLLQQNILFVGKIAQMKIPQYVSQCSTSLIFYKNISPNNYYCEANRFYQAVILGLPVIVGNNPSMKEFVDKYGLGISIDDDGCSIDKIAEAIYKLFHNYDQYQVNNIINRNIVVWDQQEDFFKDIVGRWL